MDRTSATPAAAAKSEEELRYERDRVAWNLPTPVEPALRTIRADERGDTPGTEATPAA